MALAPAERLEVFPFLQITEPAYVGVEIIDAFLCPAVPFVIRLKNLAALAQFTREEFLYFLEHCPVIALDRKDVTAFFLRDFLADFFLAHHGIACYDGILYFLHIKKLRAG